MKQSLKFQSQKGIQGTLYFADIKKKTVYECNPKRSLGNTFFSSAQIKQNRQPYIGNTKTKLFRFTILEIGILKGLQGILYSGDIKTKQF